MKMCWCSHQHRHTGKNKSPNQNLRDEFIGRIQISLSKGPFYDTKSIEIHKNGQNFYSDEITNEIDDEGTFQNFFFIEKSQSDFQELENEIFNSVLLIFNSDSLIYEGKPSQSIYSLEVVMGDAIVKLEGTNFPKNIHKILNAIFAYVEEEKHQLLVNKPHVYSTFKDVYTPVDPLIFDSIGLPEIKEDSIE